MKLLRALDGQEVRRVGESRTRRADVRVVAATNRELVGEVARGAFRADLYHRLKVIQLRVPPLRERREDIPALAQDFLEVEAGKAECRPPKLAAATLDRLLHYDWPGNVRELKHAIEHAFVISQGKRIELEHLPEDIARACISAPLPLDQIERDHILYVLALNRGNRTRTAKDLGIGPATLWRKLKKYGVNGDAGRSEKPAPSPSSSEL